MKHSDMALVFCAVILTFTAFYAPQPLLPLLADEFGVSGAAIALVISVTMLPLSIAPVAYGFLLQSVPAKRMLVAASGGLAVTSVLLALGPGYQGFLAVRLLQGLLLPAMMTALMTYVSATVSRERLAPAMASYVATTVAGGFLGRAFAGQVTEILGWQGMFAVLAALLIGLTAALTRLRGEPRAGFGRLNWQALGALLSVPGLGHAYLTIFCAFFVFASMLNFLPFRMIGLEGDIGPGRIALIYTGYLMGIVVALMSGRVARVVGSQRRLVILGLLVYLISVFLFAIPSVLAVFLTMFLFCAGMFTVHGVLPGLVNAMAPAHGGVVNGLYLCCYYLGGMLGAWLPGYVLELKGWNAFILVLAGVVVVAIVTVIRQPETASDG